MGGLLAGVGRLFSSVAEHAGAAEAKGVQAAAHTEGAAAAKGTQAANKSEHVQMAGDKNSVGANGGQPLLNDAAANQVGRRGVSAEEQAAAKDAKAVGKDGKPLTPKQKEAELKKQTKAVLQSKQEELSVKSSQLSMNKTKISALEERLQAPNLSSAEKQQIEGKLQEKVQIGDVLAKEHTKLSGEVSTLNDTVKSQMNKRDKLSAWTAANPGKTNIAMMVGGTVPFLLPSLLSSGKGAGSGGEAAAGGETGAGAADAGAGALAAEMPPFSPYSGAPTSSIIG